MTLADLNVRVGFLNDLKKGLGGIERDLRRASRNFAQAGNEIAMSLSLPLGAFAVKAVQTSAEMESLKLAMRTTFQDAGRSIADADKELEALRKSAMAPGLEFEGAVKGSIALQNVGYSAEQSRKIVEQLANTISMSGGDPESMNRVIKQFTQMSAKGRILQEDLGILVENMPALSKIMKDTFGTANAEQLRDMGVSADEFIQKTIMAMEKLPRVSGGLANSITNMGQAVKTFLATIGDDLAETFDLKNKFDELGGWLQGVAAWFKGLSASTKEWILYVGAAVIALGPLLKLMAGIGSVAGMVITFMGNIVGMLKGVAGAAMSAAKAFQAMSMAQKATLAGLGIAILVAAATLWSKYSDSVDAATQSEQRVKKAISDTQTEIAKEQIQANILFETLKDLSKGTDERSAALDTLKSKYPTYLEGMKLEELSLGKIETAQKLVNEQIVKSVALRMKAAAQEEVAAKIAAKLTRITQLKGGAQFTPTEGLGVGVMDIAKYGSAAAGVIAKMQREVDLLKGELVNLDNQFEKTFNTQKTGESVVTSDMLDKYYNPEAPMKKGAEKGGGEKKGTKKGKGEDVKTTTSVLQDLEKAYAAADVRAQAFGATYDANAERASALQSAIVSLLDMGMKPTDAAVAPLVERWANLNAELGILPAKMSAITSATAPLLETTTQLSTMADTINVAWMQLGETMTQALQSAGQAMIEYANAGGASLRQMGKEALKSAASVARAALISFVTSVIKDTGIAAGPLGAIVGPAAGAAAGLAFNGILKGLKIPAFAKGGGPITEPTMAMFGEYPGARTNPEYALRQDQLQGLINKAVSQSSGGGNMTVTGTLRGNGRELLAVIEQASFDQVRRGG
jgi:tape measure domain-containing protein